MTAGRELGAMVLLVALFAGCDDGSTGAAPAPAPATAAPGPPAAWTWVASDDGAVWLSLPPWLEVFDEQGAIFANEPPAGKGLQLLAEGRVEPTPPAGDLVHWLTERVASPGSGLPLLERVHVPAGPAIRLHRVDRAGTPLAWEVEAWVIGTPDGVAFLMVDGPPVAWDARVEEVRLIATLLRVNRPAAEP
jgi:hypothetical protein